MTLPQSECERIFAGESPFRVWREYLGFDLGDLRRETDIKFERLEKLDQGKGQPMSREEALKLGRVMDVAADNIMPHARAYRSCSGLDVDEDAIVAEAEEPAIRWVPINPQYSPTRNDY